MAKITKIFLSRVKKEKRIEIEEGRLIEDFGLEGDSYSESGSNRQLTLFFDKCFEEIFSEPVQGLCFSRFKETIRITGLNPEVLQTGTKIQIENALLSVSSPRKKCYPECLIIKDGRKCSLSRNVRFCRILQTGTIRKGSIVKIIDRD